MKITSAQKHLINAHNKKIPAFLWGGPGIGKSSIVKQTAKQLGLELIDVRLPQLEPTDLRGIPVPNHSTRKADNYYPEWLPKDGSGILFLDEMEKALVSVKNAALQLVLDRAIGDYTLPEGWSIVAAGNREDDGAFSQQLGTALANRLIHLNIEPDYNTWLIWAKQNNIQEGIMGYLAFRPDHLYKLDVDATMNAFPSPRSWEMLNTMLDGIDTIEEQNELLEATVGNVVGKEYRVWLKVYKNVNVEDIVLKGILPEVVNEQSAVYAITMAVAHYVKKCKSVEGIETNVAKFVSSLGLEMRAVFCRQVPTPILTKLIRHSSFREIAEELMKVMFG
jgi:MoxR-like ATPase